jgi:dienelactone hydrolase
MKKYWIFLLIALSATTAFATAAAPPNTDAVTIATRLLDHMEAGEYDAATADFSAEMKAALGADKLAAVQQQIAAAGAVTGRDEAKVSEQSGLTIVVIRIHRALAAIDANIAIDGNGKVAGLHYAPAPPPAADAVPADANYSERDFSVGTGERALPGTLAMPKGAGQAADERVPAVVMVQGSGPQDRDETIGPNRPFLDIARGLASQGIAVLRYEKRTKARPQDFASGDYTVDDEITNDAVAAVAELRRTPGIDPERVFVFGHSQGGMIAPRIAQRADGVAGLVLFAAPARSLLTILPEQNRYLFGLDGTISPEEQTVLDKLDAQIAALRGDAPVAAADTPLGQPAHYWRTLEQIDPVADAQSLKQPMLLLQGGRDFQVIDTDWQRWHKAFDGNPRATFKHYAALSHLGIAGSGRGSLEEYRIAGHVDPQLIADVANWIQAH